MKMEFGRGFSGSDGVSEKMLYVNNCGLYKNIDCEMSVKRPFGRRDYQVIYISEGSMIFEYGKRQIHLECGNVVIYRPEEPQIYRTGAEKSSFYWFHFSGTEAETLLRSLGLVKNIYYTGEFSEFASICKKMIRECSLNTNPNECIISSFAAAALALIPERLTSIHHPRFRSVIKYMHSDSGKYKTEDYAQMCGLSIYHFIRAFKSEYGMTPHAYEQKIVMEKSRCLLIESDLKIGEIAKMVGFEDALYFSRIFKKNTGVSPRKYREQNR